MIRSLTKFLVIAIALTLNPYSICQEIEITEFDTQPRPVYATFAPGDSSRLYIVGQGFTNGNASIRILDLQTHQLIQDPFLQESDLVCCQEAGLLCIAFHPDYQQNGLLYIVRIVDGTTSNFRYEIVEYSRLDNETVDIASQRLVLSVDMQNDQHNGGWIGFGPDGFLYATVGDDQFGIQAQNNNNLLGTMIRIDPLGDDGPTGQYGIPVSNPLVGKPGRDEIWSFGLRNPWRASFDRLTGDLYIGDVGDSDWEEISVQPASSSGGENYGWPEREGTVGDNFPGAIDPIHDYFHGFGQFEGLCVVGGYVYRGPIEALHGTYIFGDNRFGKIWSLIWDQSLPAVHDGTNFTGLTSWTEIITKEIGPVPRISSFAEDYLGNVYFLEYTEGLAYRIDDVFIRGDVNCDSVVDLLDVAPFVNQVLSGKFANKADMNEDGIVDLLDVSPFVEVLSD